jgi:SAM-dependent methyltransferase
MTSQAVAAEPIADPYSNPASIENRFRRARFVKIQTLIEQALDARRVIEIIDLGGREVYWDIGADFLERHRGRIKIHLVNLEYDLAPVRDAGLFEAHAGDACDARRFDGCTFDLVHSNSVIEHVGGWERMVQFADNVRRLGPRYYVQTPNFWFPLEPHFRMPAFQWLPARWRTHLLQMRRLGFYDREPDYREARAIIDEIRLLTRHDMAHLFPDADIGMERVAGLPKSIMASRAA